ncbi:MAG TPA: DUF4926 domain-containing protein [Gemmatimonadaceae bacterium]|nr:DUF4926 domain-containing protein [Gemmatimonadaceae bacterium]
MTESFRELDTVVLLRDLPEAGLRAGDVGAIVHMNAPESLDVEFVTAAGTTQALVTLNVADVRKARDNDLLAVRPAAPRRGVA